MTLVPVWAQAAEKPPILAWPAPGEEVVRSPAAGAQDAYPVFLREGTLARMIFEQEGLDIAVAIEGPDGQQLVDVDSPQETQGREIVSVIASTSGEYRLVVRAVAARNGAGRYRWTGPEFAVATARDRQFVEAEYLRSRAYGFQRTNLAAERRQALATYREALAIWRNLGERREAAAVLRQIGILSRQLGEGAAALTAIEESLAIDLQLGDYREAAACRNQIGLTLWGLGREAQALAAFEEAATYWRNLPDEEQLARVLNNQGLVLIKTARLAEAESLYRQVLAIFISRGDLLRESIARNNLSQVLVRVGQPVEAFDQLEQALHLAVRLGDRPRQAEALNNLADLAMSLGEAQTALDRYRQAEEIFAEVGDRRRQAKTLSNLANLHSQLFDGERALTLLGRALDLQRAVGDRAGQAYTLLNLGFTHRKQGRSELAEALLRRALDLFRELGDRRGEASTLNVLGPVLDALGQRDRANEHLRSALLIVDADRDPDQAAQSHWRLGQLLLMGGDLAAAKAELDRGLDLARRLGRRGIEALVLRDLAKWALADGSPAALHQAEAWSRRALNLAEALRADLVEDDWQAAYWDELRGIHEVEIELLMRRSSDDAQQGATTQALLVAEQARARGLLDLLAAARVDPRLGLESALVDQERSLRWQVASRDRRTGQTEASSEEEGRELQRIRGLLVAADPRGALVAQLPVLDVVAELDEQTVLLEYALLDERSFVWLVDRRGVHAFELAPRIVIEEAARAVWERTSRREVGDRSAAVGELATLSALILAPVAGKLRGRRLAIVADGALQAVPFAALPWPGGGSGAGSEPLIASHEIVMLPSAAVLHQLRRPRPDRPSPREGLALFADPVFSAEDPRTQKRPALLPDTELEALATRAAQANLARLPWTRREAEAIVAMARPRLTAEQLLTAFDFASNRELALSPELARFRYLHFATHGLIDSRHPAESALVLSRVDAQGAPQEGNLRLRDIYAMNLAAELVVLSGCRTALGREFAGEGLVGLVRGFLHAGVPRVIASLWSIEDRATAELMRHFYRGIFEDRLAPAAALRQAQLALRRDPRFSDPYFWAAFQLQGDWRPVPPL